METNIEVVEVEDGGASSLDVAIDCNVYGVCRSEGLRRELASLQSIYFNFNKAAIKEWKTPTALGDHSKDDFATPRVKTRFASKSTTNDEVTDDDQEEENILRQDENIDSHNCIRS